MATNYISTSDLYTIPSTGGPIGDVKDYQTLSEAELQRILKTDYSPANSILEDANPITGIESLINAFGDGIDQDEVLNAWMTSQAELESAVIEAQATCYAAELSAMSETNKAVAQANADMFAADMNFKAVQEQCKADIEMKKIDLQIAQGDQENDAKQIDVDMARVRVEQIAAEGEAERDKDEGEAKLLKAQATLYESDYPDLG